MAQTQLDFLLIQLYIIACF